MPLSNLYTTLSMGVLGDEARIASGYELVVVTHWEDRPESGVQHVMNRAQRLEVARHLMQGEWAEIVAAIACITNLQSPDADLEQVADAIRQIALIVKEMEQLSSADLYL